MHGIVLVAHHKPDQVARVLSELDSTLGDFVYIVVNNSPDREGMSRVVDEFKATTAREVRHLRCDSPWLTPAMNFGLSEAFGISRFAVYLCSVHTHVHDSRWLRSGLRWMKDNRRIGIAGTVLRVSHGPRFDKHNFEFYVHRNSHFDYLGRINKRWWRRLGVRQKRRLQHVQGGIWFLNEKMVRNIGMPSDDFYFSYVDVEYSFRALSFGYTLGNMPFVWSDEGDQHRIAPKGTMISHRHSG
jgi:hypothetical protein